MLTIDGSYGEGGGALVRTALALATLTNQPCKITNIRSGRPKPGLKAQHLTAIKALQEMSNAKATDVYLGSKEVMFIPGKIKPGTYEFDIGTAGSISLFLQAIILPCLFAEGKISLTVKGGTCGKWQASVDYIQNLLFPQLRRFVDKIDLKILKRGYYPKGGGEILLEITPRLKFDLEEMPVAKIKLVEQGTLEQIRGIVNVSSELAESEVAERIQRAVQNSLKSFEVPVSVRTEYAKSLSVGGEALVWALYSEEGTMSYDNPVLLGASALLEKGKSSETIGKEASLSLENELKSESAVDHYLADQLIPFMGLLPGSEIKVSSISDHLKTNIFVVEKFLPVGFSIKGDLVICSRL